MARWGKCDFKDLQRLQKKMERFEDRDADAFCRKVAYNLAQRLYRRTKDITPWKTKNLKNSWTISETVEIGGNTYEVEVYNPVEYAQYVEFGHRIRGHKGYVIGFKMLTKSTIHLDSQKEKIIEKMLNEELRKLFDD